MEENEARRVVDALRERGTNATLARVGVHQFGVSVRLSDGREAVWDSDGTATLEQMALAAKKLGLKYFGFADHSQSLKMARGLEPERVIKQHEEIDALNSKLKGIHLFKGIESDILPDGSLDYSDKILDHFDYIVASVHTSSCIALLDGGTPRSRTGKERNVIPSLRVSSLSCPSSSSEVSSGVSMETIHARSSCFQARTSSSSQSLPRGRGIMARRPFQGPSTQ